MIHKISRVFHVHSHIDRHQSSHDLRSRSCELDRRMFLYRLHVERDPNRKRYRLQNCIDHASIHDFERHEQWFWLWIVALGTLILGMGSTTGKKIIFYAINCVYPLIIMQRFTRYVPYIPLILINSIDLSGSRILYKLIDFIVYFIVHRRFHINSRLQTPDFTR